MGFLDNLRDRFCPQDDDYYDDEYDDYYDDDNGSNGGRPNRRGGAGDPGTSGVLGNTRRPEAESVSVYTRSGRPVDNNRSGGAYPQQAEGYRPAAPARRAPEREYAPREREYSRRTGYDAYGAGGYAQEETAPVASHGASVLGNTTDGNTPADIGLKPIPRQSTSGKLPPYVLKPASYDDVQMVVRRVRTGQPVVLAFRNTNIDTAKRILDFCFGLSCGISGSVEELGDRVFAVIPQGIELSQTDIDKLVQDGTIER